MKHLYMIDVKKLILPKHRDNTIHKETEESLMKVKPRKWTPIMTNGYHVKDGVQRVLVARKYNIVAIPYQPSINH